MSDPIDDGGPAFPQEATAEAISRHTPGPWLAYQANSEVGTNYWRIRTAPPGSGDTLRGYCGEANARLIAAAPDLLEALLGMVEMFELTGNRLFSLNGKPTTYDKAKAAIAKVEGGAA